ncbi:MAG TPA: dephospho-CoA kinase [Chitinophagaceae bacterium]|nr:dephospho-CoA kinase [Chitinophagaceae bacterium]
MLKVGLTGGIGSGKSTVAGIFEMLGIPVYYADEATKRLMNTSPEIKEAILTNFGEQSYVNGELNRKFIASIVFSNKEKLELLNSITHPATIEDAEKWMSEQNSPYVLKEAALLFESGAAEKLDYVIGVYAPQHIRVKRVMERDKVPVEEVMKRISRQIDEEMKMKLCDFVITNNEQKLVIPQVLELDKKFREMAS